MDRSAGAIGPFDPSLLVIVIDLESLLIGLKMQDFQRGNLDVNFIVSSLAAFVTSFSLMNRNNRLCILSFTSFGVDFIFPSKFSLSQHNGVLNFKPCLHELYNVLSETIPLLIGEFLKKECAITESVKSSLRDISLLSTTLSMAMTLVHRQRQIYSNLESRILILQFDKEVPQNYNSVMNCIFSAKKLDTMLDALILANNDSHLLQQACYLTGGFYKKHSDWRDLQLILQAYYVGDRRTRQLFQMPTQQRVDFKASCYCHQAPVEFAFMCSVCLSLFCDEPVDRCSVCQTPIRRKLS